MLTPYSEHVASLRRSFVAIASSQYRVCSLSPFRTTVHSSSPNPAVSSTSFFRRLENNTKDLLQNLPKSCCKTLAQNALLPQSSPAQFQTLVMTPSPFKALEDKLDTKRGLAIGDSRKEHGFPLGIIR
eukprot:TRINITY_DN16974_c1_g4_i1.p2 TRINITY_DN16974_c1_g4~~TRINITY_DN16974_c1_g4_i1.p2  ORF type:complete len:128 (-),score=11.69 TRINITY_DN16974_c1_g4_i1:42-425(-)